jgi:hypothetical protein
LNLFALAKGANIVGGLEKDNKPLISLNSSTSLITSYQNPYLKGQLIKDGDILTVKYNDLGFEIAYGKNDDNNGSFDKYFKAIERQEFATEKDLNDYALKISKDSFDPTNTPATGKLVRKDDLVNFLKNKINQENNYPVGYLDMIADLEKFETEYFILGSLESMFFQKISIEKSEKGFALFFESLGTSFASPRELNKEKQKETINDFPNNAKNKWA